MDKYYPIMLDIKNKKCKVIGGGRVAERKVTSLLECGAIVEVISPFVSDKLFKYYKKGKIKLVQRNYKYGDLKGGYLVYAATDNEEINEICIKECRDNEILLNVADQPNMCDFIVPANIRRGDLNISISTNGKSPMLSKKIRIELEKIFPEEYKEYLEIIGEIREKVKEEIKDISKRREIFHDLVYSDVFKRYLIGELTDLKKALYDMYFYNYGLQGADINGKKGNNNRQ
ncbi:precorrin-2 dehydrogenase/sirohydrochlorin ferrochelatase family protein [Maledivibacter halophilus]|uniref:precorrin-2 dehydrogenase n=1 Tax=Maledivibacter halophilus TaxID=36842 RepID=A0A1T5LHZ8_9FIRM|nr:bifunctional precorrin-2 dehydrogenase/sirohydrochlorin ferrochelatase [Maledivibacter halophilus]SKC75601.1 precorrin-2 dehydrogenase / sirohydrochlorin ferrochelatase [Maledivibacter halophilus]